MLKLSFVTVDSVLALVPFHVEGLCSGYETVFMGLFRHLVE